MPDKPDRMAFLYGPVVLAADLSGGQPLGPTTDGPGPGLLPKYLIPGDPLPMLIGSPREILGKIKAVAGKPLEFIGEKINKGYEENAVLKDLRFMPLYKTVNEKYTVYMDTFTEDQRRELLQARHDLNITGEKMTAGQHADRTWYQAEKGGWFAFDLKVPQADSTELVLTYWCEDKKDRQFDIFVEDTKIAEQDLKDVKARPFTDYSYVIPAKLTSGKEKVRIKLVPKPGKIAGKLYDAQIVARAAD